MCIMQRCHREHSKFPENLLRGSEVTEGGGGGEGGGIGYLLSYCKKKKKKKLPSFGNFRKSGNFRKCGISDNCTAWQTARFEERWSLLVSLFHWWIHSIWVWLNLCPPFGQLCYQLDIHPVKLWMHNLAHKLRVGVNAASLIFIANTISLCYL